MGSDPTARADTPGPGRYRFGGIVLDAAAHTLTRDGQPQALEPKAFAVLLELVGHAGELVGRDQLLDAVWGHRHVTPGVLTRAIAQLRIALDDDSHHPRYIQTQHALGYRFIGVLEVEAPLAAASPTSESTEPTPAGAPPADWEAPGFPGIERRRGPRSQPWHWLAFAGLLFAALAWSAWQRKHEPPHPAEASIAVLPFTTLSDERTDRYFAEGLAAEMLNALAGVHGIRVAAWIPPEAVDRTLDIKAMGRKLGVATILDASVRREGQRLRISARLADTASGYTLWSHTYERETSAVFDTQTEIANEVAKALVGVLPDAGEGLRRRLSPTRNVAAFDSYLRGLQVLMQPGDDDEAALGYFQQALTQDAGFARAQAGICRIEVWRSEVHRSADAMENAQLACLRAANMDPTIGYVQLALGDLQLAKGNTEKALEQFRLAEGDQSVRVLALVGLARAYFEQGKTEESFASFGQALEIEPENAHVHASLGYQYYLAGKLPEAVAAMEQATRLKPDNAENWSTYGALLMMSDRNGEAIVALEKALAIEPVEFAISNLGTLRYQAGDYAGAAAMYRRAIELNPGDPQAWGNLGTALVADPATAAQAREPYQEAARRMQAHIDSTPGDARALAMLGLFRANLDDTEAALALVRESEALGKEPAEVALLNAETLTRLGDLAQAGQRIAAARAAGIAESRIATNALFLRAHLVSRDAGTDPAESPPPSAGTAQSPGD